MNAVRVQGLGVRVLIVDPAGQHSPWNYYGILKDWPGMDVPLMLIPERLTICLERTTANSFLYFPSN